MPFKELAMNAKWAKRTVRLTASLVAIALAFGTVACAGHGMPGMGCCGESTPATAAGGGHQHEQGGAAPAAGAPAESGSQKSAEAATAKATPQGIVNAKCPIMGGKVDPNAPEGLTRIYKGQKIGFCCGGCPGTWDKLTDQQKDAKLQAVGKAG